MAYNLTQFINNSDTFPNMISVINDASNGFFIGGVLVLFFIILFIAMKFFGTKVALLSSSMILSFISILAWWGGWLAFNFILIPIVFFLVSLVYFALSE